MLIQYKKNILTLIICGLVLALLALLVFKPFQKKKEKPERNITVGTDVVKTTAWQKHIRTTGTINAFEGIILKSELEGRISQLYFQSGQDVKAGTPILALDNKIQKAQLNMAQVQLELSQNNYERQQKLYKVKAVSTEDLEQAKTDLKNKQAAVHTAEATLAQTIIQAPFDGRLGILNVHIGDYLTKGQTIVTLNNLNRLYIDFSVPETYMAKIKKGQTILLSSSAYPKQTFTGKVDVLENMIDPDTRTLAVRGILTDPSHQLLPGNFVDVQILVGEEQALLSVPQIAVNYASDGQYVYTVKNGQAQKTTVVTGRQIGQDIQIVSSLKIGDIVISTGTNKVNDGSLVTTEKPGP